MKVSPKLTSDLKKPFVMRDIQREDDTSVNKAIREAFVNMIIHSDYRMDAGVLKIIKAEDGFTFTNPGNLKLPKEQIYSGGNSKVRNPHMQTMLRMVGFGENAGSGFPDILRTWEENGWPRPELEEDTVLNQITLRMKLLVTESADKSVDEQLSADKSANKSVVSIKLSPRHKDILEYMEPDISYSRQEISDALGIKRSRTGQLLGELVSSGLVSATGATRYRRYVKR